MKIISGANEKELLRKLRGGDEMAFNQLYLFYARHLASKLIYLLKSEELAQDVLQDIFVKVWASRETIDPELNFGALLHKMATNFSKNVFRRNLYDQLMRIQVGQEVSYNPMEDSDNESQAKALLELALSKLTQRQREVYVMHKMEGRSYQEISDILEISNSAINHHIQEASKKLKLTLKSQSLQFLILLLPVLFKK